MGRKLHIGTYAGIPVYIHWTFGLLVLGLIYYSFYLGFDATASMWFFTYIATLFFCVVLHEYGHALMARKYGVATRDIIISPIGGLARLESIPEEPKQELWIAIAGPLVNVFIALFMIIGMYLTGMIIFPADIQFPTNFTEYIQLVLALNIVLFIFNLVPAFPMDGGRILRAFLAFKFDYLKATYIASILGRIFCIGFVILGYFIKSPALFMIGVFIFYMATQEYRQVRRTSLIKSKKASEIANTSFSILYEDEPIQSAIDQNKLTGERSFLVQDRYQSISGTLPEIVIAHSFNHKQTHQAIHSVMSSKIHRAHEDITVYQAFELMDKLDLGILILTAETGEISAVLDRAAVKTYLRSIG